MFNPKRKALVPAQYSSVSVRWEIPQSRAPIIQTEIIMISCVSRARLANTKTCRALLLAVLVRVAARLPRRGARVCRHAHATWASSGPLAKNAARASLRSTQAPTSDLTHPKHRGRIQTTFPANPPELATPGQCLTLYGLSVRFPQVEGLAQHQVNG